MNKKEGVKIDISSFDILIDVADVKDFMVLMDFRVLLRPSSYRAVD